VNTLVHPRSIDPAVGVIVTVAGIYSAALPYVGGLLQLDTCLPLLVISFHAKHKVG